MNLGRKGLEVSTHRYALKFGLEVKKNKIYRVIGQRTHPKNIRAGQMYDAVVRSLKDQSCQSSKVRPAIERALVTTLRKELPDELQFRLDALSQDIQSYYKTKGVAQDNISLALASRGNSSFGIVVAKDDPAQKGLLLLAVSPHANAAKLGLKANDMLLSVNGSSLADKGTYQKTAAFLRQQIADTQYGESLAFSVMREGKTIEIDGDYSAIILPKIRLDINLN